MAAKQPPCSSANHQQDQSSDTHSPPQHQVDLEADQLCKELNGLVRDAIDSSRRMPISEHVLYSSYQSYDNVMQQQKMSLNHMMSKLSACSETSPIVDHQLHQSAVATRPAQDFDQLDSLRDKYDSVQEFSEFMFDRIGQSLDDAAGLTSRDANLVQQTLQAANQNKMRFNAQNFSQKSKSSSSSHNQQQAKNQAQPDYLSSPPKAKSLQVNTSNQRPESNTMNVSSCSSTSSTSSSSSNSSFNKRNTTNSNPNQYRYNKNQQQQQQAQQQNKGPLTSNQISSLVHSNTNQTSWNPQPSTWGGYLGKQQYGYQKYAMLENKNIPRPQTQFKSKIDNSYRPFEPLIKDKPNACEPLRLNLERDDHGNEYYLHPYETEIQKFFPRPEQLVLRDPIEPPDLNSTPIVLVEELDQLLEMCRHIESQAEFAVDVEHHSYRSFQGITCLVQISTRDQDFVIDAIKLRSELHRLNQSFTNPDIVKVFHGADCDVLWLQRDFGVYVVNLFDTNRAAKTMKFSYLSLASLMKHYCNIDPDKSYQLADWRERPLPLPMLQYARADTHFLLYIFDRLRNDLLMKGGSNNSVGVELLMSVYERGREICLKRYEKPPFSATSHLSILRKSRSTFNARQMFAFKELYSWRDTTSRLLDESVGYVLPNNLMIRIAEYLPREPQGITALCNPVPLTVKKYLSDIHAIILKAIDVPLDDTTKMTTINNTLTDPSLRSIDLDSIDHKQDTAHCAGLHESSVPNLLDKMYLLNCSNDEKTNPVMNRSTTNLSKKCLTGDKPSRLSNFLDASWSKSAYNKKDLSLTNPNQSIQKQFVSPYDRYVTRDSNN